MSSRVSIVTASEVSVVGRYDYRNAQSSTTWIRTSLLELAVPLGTSFLFPLSNTRSTGVRENNTTNILKSLDLTVTFDSSTDLFRTGSNRELALDCQTMTCGFIGDGSRTRHIFIRRVGARTDKTQLSTRLASRSS